MLPVWARLASTSTGLRACAAPVGSVRVRHEGATGSRREMSSTVPAAIQPVMQYAAECNITVGVQTAMETMHSMGVPWAGTVVVSGVLLRLATAPLHVYAERLFARRLHATNFFTQKILNLVSAKYGVKVAPSDDASRLELKTNDKKLLASAEKYVTTTVTAALMDQRLQSSRIQNLKMVSVPVWIFSSFALRNIISSDFHPAVAGGLWVPNLLEPDPYCVLPLAVGAMGFLNLWSQRKIYPALGSGSAAGAATKAYDALLAFFTCFAVHIMSQMPACIPLYWLTVSATGFVQAQLLRHPRVKKALGIDRLPTDSATPIRDLFLLRRAVRQ